MEQTLLQILENKDVLAVILILALSFFLLVLARFIKEIKNGKKNNNLDLAEIKELLTNHITDIKEELKEHRKVLWDLVNRVAKLEAKINNRSQN
jgi:DNA-binding transcriptional MerR regulator